MKHSKKGRKFSRKRDQRKALLKNLAANLILKEKIITTEAKAKEVRPFIEKLITKSRFAKKVVSVSGEASAADERKDLSSVRYLAKYLPERARQKIIKEIGPRYQKRAGGYTRIIKLGPRQSDGAKMAIIEFVK